MRSTILSAHDYTGISYMISTLRVMLVPAGTGCHVIDPGFLKYEVRITDGKYRGRSGFVIRECVHSRGGAR